ncbi:MAG: T9SS type A sorting domain-containing protein [Bacteroidota bacterium]
MRTSIYSLVFCLFIGTGLNAQVTLERQVIGSLGQTATTSNFNYAATAGEAVVTTLTTTNLTLTQGFHQAEPEDLTTVHLVPEMLVELVAYPNPATDEFRLQLTSQHTTTLTASVLDINGREVIHKTRPVRSGERTQVPLNAQNWQRGLYLIRITNQEGQLTGSLRVLVQ